MARMANDRTKDEGQQWNNWFVDRHANWGPQIKYKYRPSCAALRAAFTRRFMGQHIHQCSTSSFNKGTFFLAMWHLGDQNRTLLETREGQVKRVLTTKWNAKFLSFLPRNMSERFCIKAIYSYPASIHCTLYQPPSLLCLSEWLYFWMKYLKCFFRPFGWWLVFFYTKKKRLTGFGV